MNSTTFCNKYKGLNQTGWCPCVCVNLLSICFQPSPPGTWVAVDCPRNRPEMKPSGDDKISKYCGKDGRWSTLNETNDEDVGYMGYTNFTACMLPKVRNLWKMCGKFGGNTCKETAQTSLILETVGLTVSIISLTISLYIFCKYRVLKNNRTKIHKNLFISILLEAVVRLIYYIDKFSKYKIIHSNIYLHTSVQTLLEYTKTVMFMWMFIEGLYLNNMITVTVFQEYSYMKLYLIIGWTIPILLTLIWLIVMIIWGKSNWRYYYFLNYFWILEGPRYFLIIINLLFILNIIRVLVMKLREMNTNEIEQVRKAVRAAFFLIPLMGIHNIFYLTDYHYDKSWKFATWLYITSFLKTFEGFFVSVLYCFLNGEVQTALKNNIVSPRRLRNYDQALNVTRISTAPEDTPSRYLIYRFNIPTNLLWCRKYDQSPEEKQIRICDLNNEKSNEIVCQFSKAETHLLVENSSDTLLKKPSVDGDTSSSNEETKSIL